MKKFLFHLVVCYAVLAFFVLSPRLAEFADSKFYNANLPAELGLVRVVDAAYIPSAIKSITQIAITTTGTGSQTQTVSVTKANSLLIYNGNTETANFNECDAIAVITSGTTITATSITCGGAYKGTLIEFYPNFVKSEGSSTVNVAAASTSATGTVSPSVTTAKTVMAYTGISTTGGCADSNLPNAIGTATLTATNQVTVTISNNSPNSCTYVVSYSYLEFR